MDFKKIIIWGFGDNSHTHYYTHYGWHKAFKHLGYETFWFTNHNFPNDFDFSNCLFITEGYVDQEIPINETSTYIVHVCIHPEKYLGRVKRLIDMRYLVDSIKDVNYNYTLDRQKCEKISDTLYYERLSDNSGVAKYNGNPESMDYEAVYTCWATELLPSEINYQDRFVNRTNSIYWFGSANQYNTREIALFAKECEKNGINFISNNPWINPQPFDVVMEKTKLSFMYPDLRTSGDPNKMALGETGTCHKHIGYIACRLFKSISYGQLGITNSKHMFDILDGKAIYNSDESVLFYDALENVRNYDLIKEQMEIVHNKHTFLTRAKEILEILK